MRERKRGGRSLAPVLALATISCVYPRDTPSGLEISWVVEESNAVDGQDALRKRTCEGGLLTRVEVQLRDLADDERQRRFGYACTDALLDEVDLSVEASPVFVELNPGTYALDAWAIDDPSDRDAEGPPVVVDELEAEIEIGESVQIRAITWHPPLGPLELDLTGLDACDGDLALTLTYADAALDLYDPPAEADDEDGAVTLPYRTGLVSDRDLRLDGETRACDALEAGRHVFDDVDRGAYTLNVQLGELSCARPVHVGTPAAAPLALDLSEPPC